MKANYPVEVPDGTMWFRVDSDLDRVVVERPDGTSGVMSFELWVSAMALVESRASCLRCGGTISDLDLTDLSRPRLICGRCEAPHILVCGELCLCD